jgi:hypothetical protein
MVYNFTGNIPDFAPRRLKIAAYNYIRTVENDFVAQEYVSRFLHIMSKVGYR